MRPSLAANFLYFPATRLAGERVRKYLHEYVSNDRLSTSTLRAFQEEALNRILLYAVDRCPLYEKRISEEAPAGPPSAFGELSGLPLLSKEDLRNEQSELIARGFGGRVEHKTTSGSTGQPVTVLKSRDALARERAATWRSYSWYGLEVAAPQALFWGIPHSSKLRLKARISDALANRRRFSMFGFTESDLDIYHRRLMKFRPEFIYGYVSAVLAYVRYLEKVDKSLPGSIKCIITTAEILDRGTRRYLEDATGLNIFNEYGCGEVGSIAHECERGSLHVMSDNLVLECLPVDGMPDGLGELVVTDLFNRAMPLIRYRLGDMGSISSCECACGRPYPTLERIVGRAYDMVFDSQGKAHHPEAVLYVFEDLRRMGISMPPFQAVQFNVGELEVSLCSPEDLPSVLKEEIKDAFAAAFKSSLQVTTFKRVEELAREPSGKLRVVKRAQSARP